MNKVSAWELKTDTLISELKNGKRLDGRKFDEQRKISINPGLSKNADGSSLVRLGETIIAGGVKFAPMVPYPDSPDMGTISVGVELSALASPDFEVGPPDEQSIEIARVVDRGIRESKTIDFKDLLIREAELAWTVFIDLYVLNDAGNMFDASSIAALASLLDSRIPKLEDDKIVSGEYSGKLKLKGLPVLNTFGKISNINVLDPSLLEEKASNARFSVCIHSDDQISAFQKGLGGSYSIKDINEMIDVSIKNSKKVRKTLA